MYRIDANCAHAVLSSLAAACSGIFSVYQVKADRPQVKRLGRPHAGCICFLEYNKNLSALLKKNHPESDCCCNCSRILSYLERAESLQGGRSHRRMLEQTGAPSKAGSQPRIQLMLFCMHSARCDALELRVDTVPHQSASSQPFCTRGAFRLRLRVESSGRKLTTSRHCIRADINHRLRLVKVAKMKFSGFGLIHLSLYRPL
jgi:hypothetical protein